MSNVIHGTGKPRFYIKTNILETAKIVSSTSTTAVVALDNFTDLQAFDQMHGIIGMVLWTKNNADDDTYGIITSYINASDTVIVSSWNNGNPDVDAVVNFKDIVIDLPYCERLTERWTPDTFIVKRLNGYIRTKKRGFYYSATLDYSKIIKSNILSKLRHLFRIDRTEIYFYPRRDNTKIYYRVDISESNVLELYQLQHHQGHGGVLIEIFGLERFSEAQIYDITSLSGYGYNYGTNYGQGI